MEVSGINGVNVLNPNEDAKVVQPIRDELARQKSFALAAAESVSDPAVAAHLRDLAGSIQKAVYLHLDRGALKTIQHDAEITLAA